MDFLDFEPQRIWKWNYRLTHHIWISQHHQTHITPLKQILYNTPSRLKPKSSKLAIQWHGNASFSHMSLWDFKPHIMWKWNYILIHHIFLSQHHTTHRISLIQIWNKTTSRLKPKSMKTSDTMAWEWRIFTQEFLGFWDEYNMGMKVNILT